MCTLPSVVTGACLVVGVRVSLCVCCLVSVTMWCLCVILYWCTPAYSLSLTHTHTFSYSLIPFFCFFSSFSSSSPCGWDSEKRIYFLSDQMKHINPHEPLQSIIVPPRTVGVRIPFPCLSVCQLTSPSLYPPCQILQDMYCIL